MDALNAWVEQQLAVSSGPAAWLLLLVGGIAASALPCVYPLYPITVGILRGRTSSLGALGHPLAYYAGLVGMYAVLGAVAAATGGAFNALLRLPLVNLGIGAALVVMALATAGALHLSFFQQSAGAPGESSPRSLGATFAMGAGAGLMSSACVGPVVVSVLVGLAAGIDVATAGVVALGGAKLAVFGAGVGLPILLIGVFGVGLPRAGRWMQWVQLAFAALIAAFAVGYLEKGLVGAGLSEGASTACMVAAVVLAYAVFAWQDAGDLTVHDRTRRALLGVAAVGAAVAMARAAVPVAGAAVASPSAVSAGEGAGALTAVTGNLTWHLDRERAYAEAQSTGKPVFIDFYGSWCTNCKAFETLAVTDEAFNAALQGAVLLKVYDTSPLFAEYRDDERFPELRVGLPFFVITNPKGELLYKTTDFTRTDEMSVFLSM